MSPVLGLTVLAKSLVVVTSVACFHVYSGARVNSLLIGLIGLIGLLITVFVTTTNSTQCKRKSFKLDYIQTSVALALHELQLSVLSAGCDHASIPSST